MDASANSATVRKMAFSSGLFYMASHERKCKFIKNIFAIIGFSL